MTAEASNPNTLGVRGFDCVVRWSEKHTASSLLLNIKRRKTNFVFLSSQPILQLIIFQFQKGLKRRSTELKKIR